MKKILVIDDFPENVLLLKERLEREKFEVVKAYDGRTGIKVALQEKPDLVLLDIMMPEMSGYEVCKELVTREETK